MKTLIRQTEAHITPTPEELAQCWCDMDAVGQAKFFDELAKQVAKWDKPFCFQLQAIQDEPTLTTDARIVMEAIGMYS